MALSTVRFSAAWWLLPLGVLIWLAISGLPVAAEQSPTVWTIQGQIDLTSPGGTVSVPAGTFTESLTINKSITLTGVSSTTTIIQAVAGQRVITVTGGNVRLANLTLQGGHPVGDVGGGIKGSGASLRIDSSIVANNSANYGGGIFQEGASGRLDISTSRLENNSTPNHGGAIFARGSIFLTDTEVLSNTAGWHGGGLHVDVGFTGLQGGLFSNNRANGDNGGAVNVNNGLSIVGTRFISNTAQQKGGAVLQWNAGYPVTVSGATFERNAAGLLGGGLYAKGNITITDSAFLTNTVDSQSAANTSGGGLYLVDGTVWMESTTLRGNEAICSSCTFRSGGGLAMSLSPTGTILNSLFEANSAGTGGAVSSSASRLTISGSTFLANVGAAGGAINVVQAGVRTSIFADNTATFYGGAIASGNDLAVTASTFTGNSAGTGGGAIRAYTKFSFLNSAFTGNQSGVGGQVIQLESGTGTFTHGTISQLTMNSGPALRADNATLAITNSIITSYTLGISQTGGTVSVNGLLWSGGLNFREGTGAYTNLNGLTGSPAFASDGYHLTVASPAIDHGVDSGVLSDIDGNSRPWGAGYDLGAVEYPRYRVYLPLTLRQ